MAIRVPRILPDLQSILQMTNVKLQLFLTVNGVTFLRALFLAVSWAQLWSSHIIRPCLGCLKVLAAKDRLKSKNVIRMQIITAQFIGKRQGLDQLAINLLLVQHTPRMSVAV